MKMPFGKYKGEEVENLPEGYIQWVLENCEGLHYRLVEELENQLKLKAGEGVNRGKL